MRGQTTDTTIKCYWYTKRRRLTNRGAEDTRILEEPMKGGELKSDPMKDERGGVEERKTDETKKRRGGGRRAGRRR